MMTTSIQESAIVMGILTFEPQYREAVISLFRTVFTDSEGAAEGDMLESLVRDIIDTTAECDFRGYLAMVKESVVGAILMTRLPLAENPNTFLLSPVAVATSEQGKGVGQRLIQHGVSQLKSQGIEWLFTYGDPNYYGKVGFEQIAEQQVQAPYPLQYPAGWLIQSLTEAPVSSASGKTSCVAAFQKPEIW